MTLDPVKIMTTPVRFRAWVLALFLTLYVAVSFAILFHAVIPDMESETVNETFAVDSTVFTYLADALREGRYDPYVIGSLASFPNTLWVPVAVWFVMHSALLVMLTNYALFIFSLWLLSRTFSISLVALIPLLLLNPTTSTSLLCLNKEIFDLLNLSLFLY